MLSSELRRSRCHRVGFLLDPGWAEIMQAYEKKKQDRHHHALQIL